MSQPRTLLLALALTACGQVGPSNEQQAAATKHDVNIRAEFLRLAVGDPWAKWPDGLQENPADDGQPCERVSEQAREQAIARLADAPAAALDAREYATLIGAAPPATESKLYLLRGFSTANSTARFKVTGNAVTVHSDALGGLSNLRRHPCVAALSKEPSEVYTVVACDL